MPPRLIINSLNRTTRTGVIESLEFDVGVNVIVGEQNSGKSTWLKMLDFLMFQTRAPRERFDDVLIAKYGSIAAELTVVGERTFTLAKAWDADGAKASMSIDGEKISAPEAEAMLLDLLRIPVLRFPQGSLSSDRTWPTLGWRSMYRHIYRRQDFWNDLVPEQPDSEQQAVLLQFLGLAESLFSDELAELADKRREIIRAENRKDFFFNLVQQIAPGLFPDDDLQVGLSEDSIISAKARLDVEIGDLVNARSAELKRVRNQVGRSSNLQSLLDRRAQALDLRSDLKGRADELQARLNELVDYRATLKQEEGRLARADIAAEVFSPLRVTHCPACDQSVEHRRRGPIECFLCEQPISDDNDSLAAGSRRLKFERDQIAGELVEARDLISTAEADLQARRNDLTVIERDLEGIEVSLRPFQADASQLLPESIALLDQQIGGLAVRKQSLDRLFEPLRTRDSYTSRIDELRREAAILEGKVAKKEEQASFETASDWLGEGFTTYLNSLRALDPKTWTKAGAVTARVSDRRTMFHIDGKPAKTQLGGTLKIYFSFAYQYALLDLMRRPGTHYPGLAVLDAFPDIASGEGLRDPLGLVMKPFVSLATRADVGPIQIILTARDFPTAIGAKLIRLSDAWR